MGGRVLAYRSELEDLGEERVHLGHKLLGTQEPPDIRPAQHKRGAAVVPSSYRHNWGSSGRIVIAYLPLSRMVSSSRKSHCVSRSSKACSSRSRPVTVSRPPADS